jgi:hypothetical protein
VRAEVSLLVIVSLLGASVTASLIWPGAPEEERAAEMEGNASVGRSAGEGDDKMDPRIPPG